jgi:hypothetical protein
MSVAGKKSPEADFSRQSRKQIATLATDSAIPDVIFHE